MATVRTPFTDTGIQRKVVSNQITLVGWTEAPLMQRLGWENERKWKFEAWPPGASKKIELLQDTVQPDADTLAKAITSATATTVEVTNPGYWQVAEGFCVIACAEDDGNPRASRLQLCFGLPELCVHSVRAFHRLLL